MTGDGLDLTIPDAVRLRYLNDPVFHRLVYWLADAMDQGPVTGDAVRAGLPLAEELARYRALKRAAGQ